MTYPLTLTLWLEIRRDPHFIKMGRYIRSTHRACHLEDALVADLAHDLRQDFERRLLADTSAPDLVATLVRAALDQVDWTLLGGWFGFHWLVEEGAH